MVVWRCRATMSASLRLRAPAVGLQPCLAGRADGALAALLDDGTVAILSIDGDGATTHEVVRLEGGGAQAVACSADGALLAVASATALGVYELVGDGAGRWRARLRWRAQLRAHARALALASSASAGVAVAVGGAPGLLLFGDAAAAAAAPTASAGEQREGVLLHRGAVVVCCSFCASAERLAVATLDGRLLVHRTAGCGGYAIRSARRRGLHGTRRPYQVQHTQHRPAVLCTLAADGVRAGGVKIYHMS